MTSTLLGVVLEIKQRQLLEGAKNPTFMKLGAFCTKMAALIRVISFWAL